MSNNHIGKIVTNDSVVYVGINAEPRIGDKVLVVDNTCHHGFNIGDVVTVNYVSPYHKDYINAGSGFFGWSLRASNYVTLTPAAAGLTVKHDGNEYTLVSRKANVGDLVLVVDGNGHNNPLGSVVKIEESEGYLVRSNSHCTWMKTCRYLVLEPKVRSFKVGDIIRGLPGNGYYITNEDAVMKVISEADRYGEIKVKVLSHKTKPDEIGGVYWVDPSGFELAPEPTCAPKPSPKFVKGDKVRVKTSKSLAQNDIDTSQPHTFDHYDGTFGVDDVCVKTPSGMVRYVKLDDIEPWIEPETTPTLSDLAEFAAALSAFTVAAAKLQEVTSRMGVTP